MLEIDDPLVEELATELARRRGVSVDEAVVGALKAELERTTVAMPPEVAARVARLLAVGEPLRAALASSGQTLADIDAEMYDEDGLPR